MRLQKMREDWEVAVLSARPPASIHTEHTDTQTTHSQGQAHQMLAAAGEAGYRTVTLSKLAAGQAAAGRSRQRGLIGRIGR